MTIRELIDRLKTAPDLDDDIYIATDYRDNETVSLSPVKDVIETSGIHFLEAYKDAEIIADCTELSILKPNRKEKNNEN